MNKEQIVLRYFIVVQHVFILNTINLIQINKRRVIQPEFINILSNLLQKGSLIFIKTDVKDLFDYMDCTITSNFHFKTIDKKDFNYSESFNPIEVKTNREKYVIVNELDIYEGIYMKI